VNCYLPCFRLWLTCCLMPASYCFRLYVFKIHWESCHTHLLQQALFVLSLRRELPFPSYPVQVLFIKVHWGEPPNPLSLAGFIYLEFTWVPSPPLFSSGESSKLATVAGFVYLKFAWEIVPPPFSGVFKVPHPHCYVSFSVPCLLFRFFSQGWDQTVQGSMLVYPRGGCGDTACCLFAHLLVCISQES
jgi:hypothetical protein